MPKIYFLAVACFPLVCAVAIAQQKAESRNLELVGYNGLQGRSAYHENIWPFTMGASSSGAF